MFNTFPVRMRNSFLKDLRDDPFKDFDNLFENSFFSPMTYSKKTGSKFPPVNILSRRDENGEEYHDVTMAVAGFQKEDLTITEEDGKIIVSGTSSINEEVKDDVVHTREIAFRNFKRSFYINGYFEVRDAELKDGLLKFKVYIKPPDETKKLVVIR